MTALMNNALCQESELPQSGCQFIGLRTVIYSWDFPTPPSLFYSLNFKRPYQELKSLFRIKTWTPEAGRPTIKPRDIGLITICLLKMR